MMYAIKRGRRNGAHLADGEFQPHWSTVDAVMLAFSYLIRDGRLALESPFKTNPEGGRSNGK